MRTNVHKKIKPNEDALYKFIIKLEFMKSVL